MKKISAVITGLTLSTVIIFGLNTSNVNQQVAKDKINPPIVQYSHAETW
ncbi:Phr family secreted Rap phosphatase inhibitor [Bacillus thuringiensis]|uniref:Phr family secreted Rap phosphatase inhibitor n=1 Tax=Bacillus cereus (strain VD146) TaxID=1053236 RepID=R8MDW4_BACCX|nr:MULTISPECIES: hypothetical protein [Bacillus cereus group]EOP32321.1 hypothetical protein IK1_05857 [Bacillus cereus VD146]MDZ3956272.1 Phr family secreted Rap phosphatase inhibitor [Bacillus thuringiensis]